LTFDPSRLDPFLTPRRVPFPELPLPFIAPPRRHKCFISFHQADEYWVRTFVDTFDEYHDTFIGRSLRLYREMSDDIINSTNPDYIMRRIREDYLADSTVTIVMLGRCTQSRRYVDWEIQSSLRRGENLTPNGLMAIRLPTYVSGDGYPSRLNSNLRMSWEPADKQVYARVYDWPPSANELSGWIDDAYWARFTRPELINNPRDRMEANRLCWPHIP
jgi:hypothetical protein